MSRRPAPPNPSPPAVDMRNTRINRDSVPLADDRREARSPAPARTPSRDERAPAETSRSASYFGTPSAPLRPPLRTSLEQHNPWHPSPPAYSSTAARVSHQLFNVAMPMHTSQGPNVGGGSSSIAASDAPMLQWGHGKRPRSRRDPGAPEPVPTAEAQAQAQAQAPAEAAKLMPSPGARVPKPSAAASSLRTSMEELHIAASEQQPKPLPAKEKKQPQRAEVEKPKLPPSNHAPIMIRGTSPLPPGTTTIPHRRSAEEPEAAAAAGGEQQRLELEAKWEPKPPQQRRQQPQRRASEAEKGKASLHRSEEEPRANEQEPMPKQQPQGEEAEKLMIHRSAEEPHAGATEQQPAAKEGKQQPQQQASNKEKGKAMMVEVTPHVAQKAEQQQQQSERDQTPKKQKAMAPMVEVPPHIAEKAAAAGAAAVMAIWGPDVPKVEMQLTRGEMEEDWLAMTGTKLPTRPKNKRPKKAQRRVDEICPGFSTVCTAAYQVDEEKPKKRGGGLKGLAMMDSDSD